MDAKQGLYTSAYEHDACGVGMVVNIHGGKSHELVDNALRVLENMQHRGAETRDKTGDGAGIMVQIPHEFILLQGIPVPEKGRYGTGLVFLPRDEKLQNRILNIMIEEIEREGLELTHLRNVPVNEDVPGVAAREVMPAIRQMFVAPTPSLSTSSEGADAVSLETKLYKVRKRIERRILPLGIDSFYICSLSSKNIVYKGMLTSGQLRRFYQDLTNPYFTSGLALVHSRFSTNTFPKWKLAQPFRLLCHNGEINTVRGNRAWMKARESVLSSGALGDIKDILPIVEEDMSDSASLDNVFEFLIMSGMSLPQAMAILVPESFNDKNPISEDLKAFYEYYSILMEPWDGPAALMFSDGRYAGGMLDRNGLLSICTHRYDGAFDVFFSEAESAQLRIVVGYGVGYLATALEVLQLNASGRKPLAVRMLVSQLVLYLAVVIYPAFLGVDKQNLAWLETSLADHIRRFEVHHADLACHHHHAALCDSIA